MKNLILLIATLILTVCGTTSNIRRPNKTANLPDFREYNHIIVNDFTDGASKSSDDPHIIAEGKRFADIIASSIKLKNLYARVERNIDSSDSALLIDSKITKCSEGNAFMRTLVGFGAGSSLFDAHISIKDNKTKQLLGEIDASKMSWALGGVIAGIQDVNSHMHSAASKIADECNKAKTRNNKKEKKLSSAIPDTNPLQGVDVQALDTKTVEN